MDAEKVNLFIATKSDMFPPESIPMIRERLEHLTPEGYMGVMAAGYTNPILSILLSIFVGEFGVDRFVIGDIGLGIGKLLLTCCCGIGIIWWIIDLFLITEATKQKNLNKFMIAVGG